MATDEVTPSEEIKSMAKIEEALAKLDEEGRGRVLRWAADRFGIALKTKAAEKAGGRETVSTSGNGEENGAEVEELADLFAVAKPKSEADKALVGGYWFQHIKGESDLEGQQVNKELKHLGHGVTNITRAFDSLKQRSPQLVVQTKKSGTTKQARKRYKLTTEGKKAVEAMLGRRDA